MTSFEHFFCSLKKILGNDDLYDIWPNFEPQYDKHEYAWATIRGLGEVLLLNCGICDGPCDLRHVKCENCSVERSGIAREAYEKATGRPKEDWDSMFLCRIHNNENI